MRVRAIASIPSAKGTIPVGQILEISPELVEKLKGKVEVIIENLSKPVFVKPPPVELTRAGIVITVPPRCYACSSTDLWRSRYGVSVCRVCHPPAPGAETISRGVL